MQGVGDADCFYNNPNPVSKAECGAALDAMLWKRNLSFGVAAMALLSGLTAYFRKRRISR
jgi:hypothetical protein